MKNKTDVAIGELIKKKRKEKKLTQLELGHKIHISAQSVYLFEKGNRSMRLEHFFAFCKALNLKEEDISESIKNL